MHSVEKHDGRGEQPAASLPGAVLMIKYWSCSSASILHHHLFQRDMPGPTTDPAFLMSLFSLSVSCALKSAPQHIAAKMTVLATTYWLNIWSLLLPVLKDLSLYTTMELEGPLQFTVQFHAMLTYDAIVANIYNLIGSSESVCILSPLIKLQTYNNCRNNTDNLVINKEMNWNFKHCWVCCLLNCHWANFITLLLPTNYAKYS